MRLIESFLIVFLLPTVLGFAVPQAGAAPRMATGSLNPDVAQLIEEAPSEGQYAEAGAVILLREGMMSIDKNGVFSLTVHVVGQILDEKATSDYGQIVIPFNSYYYETTLDFARIIKQDGTVIEVSKDAIEVKTLPALSPVQRYTDVRHLTFSLPALEIETVFEYQVTLTEKISLIENEWGTFYTFNYVQRLPPPSFLRIDPVYKSRLILRVPEGEEFIYQARKIKVSPTVKKERGSAIYTWELRDLPGITLEEGMPSIDEMIPRIELSSLKGWNEVHEWARDRLLSQIKVTPEITSVAQEVIREAQTEKRRIEALFYFILRRINYIQADLGRGGFIPHPPNEVLKNQYGDCKDQVTLFLSMLRAIGITAYPALIKPYPGAEVNKDVPSPYFPHLIVYIPTREGDLWLDTTSDVTQFPSLAWANQDRWALVLDGKGGRFLRTPAAKPEDNQGTIRFDLSFQDKNLNGKMTVKAKGVLNDNAKSRFRGIQSMQRQEIIRNIVKAEYGAPLTTAEFSALADPAVPFRVAAQFEIRDLWKENMRSFFYASDGLRALKFYTNLMNLPSPEGRVHDYLAGYKARFVSEEVYLPPAEGFRAATVPQDESLETRLLSFRRMFARDGDSVRARWELTLKQNRIKQADYKEFYEGIQEVVKKSGSLVVFAKQKIDEKGRSLEAAIKESPESVASLLELSRHYLGKGKYEEAKELLQKAVTIEPTNGEVRYFLGIAFSYLDEHDRGAEEFAKAKKLGYKP